MVMKLLVLFTILSVACGEEHSFYPSNRSVLRKTISRNCTNDYTLTCLKLDIVSWVDKISEEDAIDLLPGVSVIRENSTARANTADIVAELARDFPNDPDARLDAFLMRKVTGYLNSHAIKLNLFKPESVETGRGKGGGGYGGGGGGYGGGGGKGKGEGYGYVFAMAAMMKGTLMAMKLAGIAAIAGKAMMAAVMALMLSAIIGIKSLSSGGGKHTTYEVIAKPVYSHSNSHSVSHEEHGGGYGHSSYGRSFDASVPLPIGLQPNYNPPTQ